jgi:sugar/nucleoside kinase (ribokinase family)
MSTRQDGRSLELYFIDGRPDGMLTAEVFNWTGHVLMAPRTQIGSALARREAKYTGVYVLLGEQDGQRLAYIGEGEDISNRIKNHDTKKDWWTSVVLVTSAANNLHKAHVQYLEARLIEIAHAVGRVGVENGTVPSRPSLSEAAQANMEAFLEYLLLVLPALRVDMFVANTRPNPRTAEPTLDQPLFELVNRKHGITATAFLNDGEFIVEAGSLARAKWSGQGTESSTYAILHSELLKMGVLSPRDDKCIFVKNYAFKSTSAAAAVVNGRPANGTAEWKVKGSGQTYRDWEAIQLAQSAGE